MTGGGGVTPRPHGSPSELAITLACLPNLYSEAWMAADEVRGRLKLLGFDCSAQQAAAWLVRMSKVDAPWVERQKSPWGGCWEYRVTRFGVTDIENNWPGLRVRRG